MQSILNIYTIRYLSTDCFRNGDKCKVLRTDIYNRIPNADHKFVLFQGFIRVPLLPGLLALPCLVIVCSGILLTQPLAWSQLVYVR